MKKRKKGSKKTARKKVGKKTAKKKVVRRKAVKKVLRAKKTKIQRPSSIIRAMEHFGGILDKQLARVKIIKKEQAWIDYSQIKPIIVGILGGDGIGPYITSEAQRLLEHLLKDELAKKKIEFRVIEGLTIERRVEVGKPIPYGRN